jgi:CRP-like cAMP-binding protein
MLDQRARSATAVALEDAELLELDRDDQPFLFGKSPAAALGMLAAMGHMTRRADALLRTRVSRNANEEIEAELEVAHLHEKTDRIHAERHERLARLDQRLDGLRTG